MQSPPETPWHRQVARRHGVAVVIDRLEPRCRSLASAPSPFRLPPPSTALSYLRLLDNHNSLILFPILPPDIVGNRTYIQVYIYVAYIHT
jgi:hypothetical protein